MDTNFNTVIYQLEMLSLVNTAIKKLKAEHPDYEVFTMSLTTDFASGVSAVHFDSRASSERYPQRFEPGRWGHSQREKSDDWRTSGMSGPYDDIISLPHPTSSRHPRMPISDRAAQFSPFAALAGHSAALAETARLTDRQIELSDDDKAVLDQKQRILLEHIKECPEITVTWFRPDEKKDGGQYITTTGRLRRIDEFNQVLILVDDIKIPLTHVVDLDSEKLPDMNQMEW